MDKLRGFFEMEIVQSARMVAPQLKSSCIRGRYELMFCYGLDLLPRPVAPLPTLPKAL